MAGHHRGPLPLETPGHKPSPHTERVEPYQACQFPFLQPTSLHLSLQTMDSIVYSIALLQQLLFLLYSRIIGHALIELMCQKLMLAHSLLQMPPGPMAAISSEVAYRCFCPPSLMDLADNCHVSKKEESLQDALQSRILWGHIY